MDIAIWLVVGLAAGLLIRVVLPRSGVGGSMADIALGVLGGFFGGILVYSYHLGHAMNAYLFWCAAWSFVVASGMVMTLHILTMRNPVARDADVDDVTER